MGALFLQLTFLFLKIGVAFAHQHKYTQAINVIVPPERKNDGFDLKGWEYRTVDASLPGRVHRYYNFPGPHPDAPVFLFIHGLNLDGRNFVNLRALASHYRLIAYDFPDQSPYYTGKLDDFSALISDFLARQGISQLSVAGISFGGVVAVHWAAHATGSIIDKVILVSSGIVGTDAAQRKRSRSTAQWVAKLKDYQVYWLMEKMTDRFVKNFPAQTRRELSPLFRIKHPDYYREVIASTAGYNAGDDARCIACPMLVLLGTHDELFPVKDTSSITTFVPHAKIELIANGSHIMSFLDGDNIARKIAAFPPSGRAVHRLFSRRRRR
ncbi:MAG: alpha/beta hydrolase [Chitinispirillaceae bacterium]|nr:alpha/beta hydrolase [Chitinispirillaceae bacterium]